MNEAKELGKTINAILLAGDMMLNPPDDLAEFIDKLAIIKSRLDQILQACNQWLEEQGAQHKVKCSHCSWSQFTSEVAGMSPCNECNSTGYIFEPLRLEIDV